MSREVTREEFDAFIAVYPERLDKNVTAIFEPPILSYNDFVKAPKWPDSVVAFVRLNEHGIPLTSNQYYLWE